MYNIITYYYYIMRMNNTLNEIFDSKKIEISGVNNLVRLEGSIGSTNKIIYLFFINNVDAINQTECANIYSKDIHKYLAKTFYNINNESDYMLDFFMDLMPTNIHRYGKKLEYTDNYINQIRNFFARIFNYDEQKNKVLMAKHFEKIRLHYFDIRDYLSLIIEFPLFNNLESLYSLMNINDENKIISELNFTITILQNSKTNLNNILTIFKTKNNADIKNESSVIKKSLYTDDMQIYFDINNVKKFVNKINNVYNNEDVQLKILNDYQLILEYADLTEKYIINIIEYIQNTITYLLETKDKLNTSKYSTNDISSGLHYLDKMDIIIDVIKKYESIQSKISDIFILMTNLYFLRRILDKNYITNSIVCSNNKHSTNIIRLLVGIFNFKITHASYSLIPNIDQLNNQIKKNMSGLELTDIAKLFVPEVFQQCIDITNFPKKFT